MTTGADIKLKKIYQPIAKELKQTQTILSAVLRGGDRYVAEIGRFVERSPGKLLRPALVLLAAKCGKPDRGRAVNLAAAIELIHMATLTHDDVIDRAKLRRGQPSVSAKYGADKAVLFGDYLYSRAFEMISRLIDGKFPDYEQIIPKSFDRFSINLFRHCYTNFLSKPGLLDSE